MSNAKGLIYLADDNEPILELLKEILEGDGYSVMGFTESRRIIEQAGIKAPDLFILDINIPDMDGITLCKRFKSTEELQMIPVIFISGMITMEDKVKGFSAGGADYITKPFIPIDVLSRVNTHITLKKSLDQTLSFNTALEEGIRSRTEELQKAKEEAEKANREKNQLLSNINHELRTPLNGILGMLDLLNQKQIEDDEVKSYIELTTYSARQLSRLINDILDYTQLENRTLYFQYKRFTLITLITLLKQKYQVQCAEKGLNFSIKTIGRGLDFSGDETRILQILDNLITNSIKYSLKGTVTVSLSVDQDLIMTIQDQGVGIPPDKGEIIFKPYVQVQNGYIREKKGLGLGLAITKDITIQMGGTIDMTSDEQGTVFTVRIPPHQPDEESGEPLMAKKIPGRGKILVVEDDTVSLYYMEMILCEAGYEVITGINGKEAMELLKEDNYDMALLDIGLPGFSGVDIMRAIKEEGLDLPVLALTAYCQEEDINLFKSEGFKEVVAKPVNSKSLLETLEKFTTDRIIS